MAGGKFSYEVIIPANTSATVALSNAKGQTITMNELSLNEDEMSYYDESALIELDSGEYQFIYNMN